MASFESRFAVGMAGALACQTLPAVIAFLAQANAGRAGEFNGDPASGPMAEDDSGQGRGNGKKQIESDC